MERAQIEEIVIGAVAAFNGLERQHVTRESKVLQPDSGMINTFKHGELETTQFIMSIQRGIEGEGHYFSPEQKHGLLRAITGAVQGSVSDLVEAIAEFTTSPAIPNSIAAPDYVSPTLETSFVRNSRLAGWWDNRI